MNITISLPENQIVEAKYFSKETGRTFSGLIQLALRKFLKGKDVKK